MEREVQLLTPSGTRTRRVAFTGVIVVGFVLVLATVYHTGVGLPSTSKTPISETSGGTSPTNSTGLISQTPSDTGAINASSACSRMDWEGSGAMNTLRSDLVSQPKFMELAQNRTYSDGGYGCSLVPETQFTVDFMYSDIAHPFHVCGNGTAYQTYYIYAKVYLLPSGYDLSKTTYSTRYYDSQNLTVTCTTTTA